MVLLEFLLLGSVHTYEWEPVFELLDHQSEFTESKFGVPQGSINGQYYSYFWFTLMILFRISHCPNPYFM